MAVRAWPRSGGHVASLSSTMSQRYKAEKSKSTYPKQRCWVCLWQKPEVTAQGREKEAPPAHTQPRPQSSLSWLLFSAVTTS